MTYDPYQKRPKTRPERVRTFTLSGGETITLNLRKLGTVAQTDIYELTEQLKERLLTGDAEYVDSKGEHGEAPVGFPPIGGELVRVTETMIQAACMIHVMSVHEPATCNDVEWWIAFQIVEEPADWLQIQKFVREVNNLGKPTDRRAADVPLGSGADTSQSSDPSSPDTASIPSLPAG